MACEINASLSTKGGFDTIQFSPMIDGATIYVNTYSNDLTKDSREAGPSAFFIDNNKRLTIDGQTGLTKGITIARDTNSADYTDGPVENFRLFEVDTGNSLTLKGLTLEGGAAQGFKGAGSGGAGGGGAAGLGGAIFNRGNLTILGQHAHGQHRPGRRRRERRNLQWRQRWRRLG